MRLKRHIEAIEKAAKSYFYWLMPSQLPGEWEKLPVDVRETWVERVRFVVDEYNKEMSEWVRTNT